LVLMDLAAFASVTKLILQPDIPLAVGHFFIVFTIVASDIGSETVILKTHDIPLVENRPVRRVRAFTIARTVQALCTVAWVSLFIYMLYLAVVAPIICEDYCWSCQIEVKNGTFCNIFNPCPNTNQTCLTSISQCGYSETGSCLISSDNATVLQWSPPRHGVEIQNRTDCFTTQTAAECILGEPGLTDCVLLGIVLIEAIYSTAQIFFRSFIYPITLPEHVMFFSYLEMEALKESDRRKLLVEAAGRMEFGFAWNLDRLHEVAEAFHSADDKVSRDEDKESGVSLSESSPGLSYTKM